MYPGCVAPKLVHQQRLPPSSSSQGPRPSPTGCAAPQFTPGSAQAPSAQARLQAQSPPRAGLRGSSVRSSPPAGGSSVAGSERRRRSTAPGLQAGLPPPVPRETPREVGVAPSRDVTSGLGRARLACRHVERSGADAVAGDWAHGVGGLDRGETRAVERRPVEPAPRGGARGGAAAHRPSAPQVHCAPEGRKGAPGGAMWGRGVPEGW